MGSTVEPFVFGGELTMDKKTINKLIGAFDKKQLQELITHMVSTSETAEKLLLDFCHAKEADVKTDNHALIIENKIRKYWQKAAEIIDEFDCYGGGSECDEDEAYEMLENMAKLLEDNEVSWTLRKEILDELLGFVASDNSGFTDYLMDIAFVMCTSKEENLYLADFLIKKANSYYRGLAAQIYLKNGEEQKFIESKKANLEYGSDYLELAEYYKKHNDEETALKIVLEGLEKAEGRLDEIYEYLFLFYEKKKDEAALEDLFARAEKRDRDRETITELMYQYYRKKGDYGKQKETLLKLLSCCDSSKIYKLYGKCKQELTDEDFLKREKSILKIIKQRNLSVYFDILMDMGESKEVMEYITQNTQYRGWGLDREHYFSKRLASVYPREIVDMYWNEVSGYVRAGKEKNYICAAGILKEIRVIMKKNKWTDEWNAKYTIFLQEHKRKTLLLKILEGMKL